MAKNNTTYGIINKFTDIGSADSSRGNVGERGNSLTSSGTSTPEDSSSVARSSDSGEFAPRSRRLRGSCDFCTRRKRKCDGDGFNRCSLCVQKRQAVCHYSVRLPTGPRPQSSPPAANNISGGSPVNGRPPSSGANKGSFRPRADSDGQWQSLSGQEMAESQEEDEAGAQKSHSYSEMARAAWRQSVTATDKRETTGGPRYARMMPLKRARLSPSPATGLVGLKENTYIGDFFRIIGFLPFTDESDIRKAMITTVFATMQRQVEGNHDVNGGFGIEEGFDGAGEAGVNVWQNGGDTALAKMSSAEVGAAACVLWCTVALGCLVEGRPIESVVGYTNLARDALANCFDDGGVGSARAFTSMAMVQNYMGDEMKFRKYLDFARSTLAGLPPGVAPADLKETVVYMKVCDSFYMDPSIFAQNLSELREESAELKQVWSKLGEDSSESPDGVQRSQNPRIFRKCDIYWWLMRLDVRLGESFHEDIFRRGLTEEIRRSSTPEQQSVDSDDSKDGGSGAGVREDVRGTRNAPDVVLDDNSVSSCHSVRQIPQEMEEEMEEPPPPGEMSRRFAANTMEDFDSVKHVEGIEYIRDGVGELHFQSMMAYIARLEGRLDDTINGLKRCAKVIVEHPGLCRYTTWRHLTHMILSSLAKRGIRREYSELREAYNSMMDRPGTLKAPPLEEWSGMKDICDNCFCRSIASLTAAETDRSSKSEMIPTSPPVEDDIEDDRNGGHTSTPPPSIPSSRQELDGCLSPDVRRNYYPQEAAREEHWAVAIDDCRSSEGKESDSNGVGSFSSANGGVTVARNDVNVPGRVGRRQRVERNPTGLRGSSYLDASASAVGGGSFSPGDGGNKEGRFEKVGASHSSSSGCGGGVRNGEGRRQRVELNPTGLGGSSYSNANAAAVGGGSFSPGDGGNEEGMFQEVGAIHSSSSGCGGGGVRNGDVPAVNNGSDLLGFHTKQFTPLPLARREDSVDESDGVSIIDALDALLTAADSETYGDDEANIASEMGLHKLGRGWTGYGGGGGWAQ